MKTIWKIIIIIGIVIVLLYGLFVGRYNTMVSMDEGVKTAWGQVENQYQRRFDLIPNLVNTVKGYAAHEKETFLAVTEARSKVGQMKVSPQDTQSFGKFVQAQQGLSSALSRLMVVVEKYPDLKANQNFLDLQAQLEGTENRIATERMRYNETVKIFNIYIRKFPNNILAKLYGFEKANLFEMDKEAKETPKVKF